MTSVVTRTPHRVSFAGGGTDFKEYFVEHGAAVLSAAIDKYMYVVVGERVRDNGILINNNGDVKKYDHIKQVDNDIVRICLESYGIVHSVEVLIHSELPQGCGMASSSALTVGLLMALKNIRGFSWIQSELAMEAIAVEADILKRYTGWQDQFGVVYPGLKVIEMLGTPEGNPYAKVRSVRASQRELNNLMLVDTQSTRSSVEILKTQKENIKNNLESLHNIRSNAFEMIEEFESTTPLDIDKVGRLLGLSWIDKKKLSPDVTNDYVNGIYALGLANGGIGGKLLGAGSGGFMLFAVEPDQVMNFVYRMNIEYHYAAPVILDKQGAKVIEQYN